MKTVEIFLVFLLANNLLFFPFLGLKEALQDRVRWLNWKPLLSLTVVLAATGLLLWFLDRTFLGPWGLAVLKTPLYILVLWGGAEGVRFLVPTSPDRAGPHEILLNSFLFGACWFLVRDAVQWYDVLVGALAAGLGYALGLALLEILHSRLIREKVPSLIQGLPLQLVACGLVSLALSWTGR